MEDMFGLITFIALFMLVSVILTHIKNWFFNREQAQELARAKRMRSHK